MKYSLLYPVALTLLCSCSNQPSANLDELQWMLGRWEQSSPEGQLSETWTQLNDSTFTGDSYFVAKKDTLFSEKILLTATGNGILYTPTVADQNEGKPVDFKMTSSGKFKVSFENKNHDFPQKIAYSLHDDYLKAVISGKQSGATKSETFLMKRSD